MAPITDPPPFADPPDGESESTSEPRDLEACPRCGHPIETIVWGQTDCPNCGLHFECC